MQMLRLLLVLSVVMVATGQSRWSNQKARDWYRKQPWLVGANFLPATAINQLEMWQAATFDAQRIDQEMGWAAAIGMNTMRVYLHDLPWQEDAAGFRGRIDQFLTIAARHGIRPVLVLFDSCWDPEPRSGRQREPRPGVHNSGWVQSPGAAALMDLREEVRLEAYVKGVVGAFAKDKRILAWDVWNEPDNMNNSSYLEAEPAGKIARVEQLLPKVFGWARSARPQQPLTSGVWKGDWSADDKLTPTERVQLNESDVISFHNYTKPEGLAKMIASLERFGRPMLCTEYMARGAGSTFENALPVLKGKKIAAINWGLVQGKSQTHMPWDSWKKPYVDREPEVWFHEVLRGDGRPYREEEVRLSRQLTGR